ncbi:MAG: hypothetical protein ABIY50_04295 [Ignavibacteria bacterium]
MKLVKIIIHIFILFLTQQVLFSQTNDPILVAGKNYKIILFSEKEIIGTFVSQDEKTITIKTDNILLNIEKSNILSISKDVSATKYKFIINLSGKFVPRSHSGSYFGNSARSVTGIDIRASYFYSEKKNVGIEFAYFPFTESNSQSSNTTVYTGGETNSFDLLLNGQFGTFDNTEIADVYFNLGAGIHSVHKNASTTTFYDSYLGRYQTYSTASETESYPVMQFGVGILVKPVKNIGINFEINLNAYGFGYLFFPSAAYIPLKAGVSYYFMK